MHRINSMKKIILFVVCALGFLSCKQEGCTDPFALNYSPDAEKNNGTCVYEGRVMVWFNSVTATDLVNASIPSVDIVINGEMEGSVGMTQFSVGEPECGGNEGFLAYVDMTSLGTQSFPYFIYKSGTTDIIKSGNVAVTANNCQWIELTY